MGLAGRGVAGHVRIGTCYEYRHPVDEAWPGLGGALRGRSPRTREGRLGPTAQMRGERSEERDGVSFALELIAAWQWLVCRQKYTRVRPHFGMQPWRRPLENRIGCPYNGPDLLNGYSAYFNSAGGLPFSNGCAGSGSHASGRCQTEAGWGGDAEPRVGLARRWIGVNGEDIH